MLSVPTRAFRNTFFVIACLAGAAQAIELPQPEGHVILTVTGAIGVTNTDGAAIFDLDTLRSIGQDGFTTTTLWTEGETTFAGVPLARLLEALEVRDGTLRASAINDYSVSFPVEEALEDSAIVAYSKNGREMTVREKGPLWIVFPFDSDTKYRSETYYSRSIWQLDRIEILKD